MSQLALFNPVPPVELESSFEVILGKTADSMSEAERKERWEQWLSISRQQKDGGYAASVWTDTEGCDGCVHLDGYWCKRVGLPCTVNPYLSYRSGMIGMACMGAGYDDGSMTP